MHFTPTTPSVGILERAHWWSKGGGDVRWSRRKSWGLLRRQLHGLINSDLGRLKRLVETEIPRT